MRQLFLILSVLVLGVSWVAAQNPSTQTSSGSSGYGQTHSASSGEKTVEGCLSGSNGSYTLTAKNGTTYQLMGDASQLGEHVGHEVKVTGTMNSAASTGTEASGSMGNNASHTLEVTSVKHISKSCKAGSGMSK